MSSMRDSLADEDAQVEERAEEKYANGAIYKGYWKQGTTLRWGKGKLVWQDKSYYEGDWKNN